MYKLAAVISAVLLWSCNVKTEKTKLEEAKEYLAYLDIEVCKGQKEKSEAEFNYYSNITDENLKKMRKENSRSGLFDAKYIKFDWECFDDPDLLRQATLYGLLDKQVPQKLLDAMANITAEMINAGNADFILCSYKNRSICGDEAYSAFFDAYYNTNDTKEMAYYWKVSNDPASKAVRPFYEKYINIGNKLAKAQGFENKADLWMSSFESPPVDKFEGVIMDLYNQVKPLYMEYHAFKRSRLRKYFGKEAVPKRGPIPIQLLGLGAREGFKPYPGKKSTDLTQALIKQNYTVMKMVEQVEDYYESMGLGVLPKSFYEKSMFEKPADRNVSCDPVSFDFFNKVDFRISVCLTPSGGDFDTLVHEIGHVHNFNGYKDQPCCFRDPPSPGLDEGVAETMGLSFLSYKHLTKLGLVEERDFKDPDVIINTLFDKANLKLRMIPVTILSDVWRWNIFRGNICPENINAAYWDYKFQFEGTAPPEKRSEAYLDVADVIQFLDDTQMISYFLSYLISFQFHEALCIAAKQYDPNDPTANPLYNCDLYGNKDAGTLMKNLFVLGASKSWPASMEAVTGQPNIDAGPFLRYFQPLYEWLVKENKKNKEYIGWK